MKRCQDLISQCAFSIMQCPRNLPLEDGLGSQIGKPIMLNLLCRNCGLAESKSWVGRRLPRLLTQLIDLTAQHTVIEAWVRMQPQLCTFGSPQASSLHQMYIQGRLHSLLVALGHLNACKAQISSALLQLAEIMQSYAGSQQTQRDKHAYQE